MGLKVGRGGRRVKADVQCKHLCPALRQYAGSRIYSYEGNRKKWGADRMAAWAAADDHFGYVLHIRLYRIDLVLYTIRTACDGMKRPTKTDYIFSWQRIVFSLYTPFLRDFTVRGEIYAVLRVLRTSKSGLCHHESPYDSVYTKFFITHYSFAFFILPETHINIDCSWT